MLKDVSRKRLLDAPLEQAVLKGGYPGFDLLLKCHVRGFCDSVRVDGREP